MIGTTRQQCWTRDSGRDIVPVPGVYEIDTAHTSVEFVARQLMLSRVRGRFRDFSGTVTIAEVPEESHVAVRIGSASIFTGDEARDRHLRSADFLDVGEYPEITYRSTKLSPDNGHWAMVGDLGLHGQVHPVVLDVDFLGAFADPWGGHRIAFSAAGRLPREQWGLVYNQRLDTGGFLVSRVVDLDLAVTGIYRALPEAA